MTVERGCSLVIPTRLVEHEPMMTRTAEESRKVDEEEEEDAAADTMHC